MTIPALISFTLAVVQVLFAALAVGLSRSPGWQPLRWFALVALTGSAYAVASMAYTLELPEPTRALGCRLTQTLGAMHCAAWYVYFAADEGRGLTRLERLLLGAGLAVAALAPVPGVITDGPTVPHTVAWLGVTYRDVAPTTFGLFSYGYFVACVLVLVVRSARQYRAHVPDAGGRLLSLSALMLGAINDSLAGTTWVSLPYVLDAAFLVAVTTQGATLSRRFVAQTNAHLDALRQLAEAQAALIKRERLAALGELSAVVAHEVRNPLGVIFNALSRLKRVAGGGEETRALLGVMGEEAQRLDSMVGDLLDFARPYEARRVPASLQSVVTAAVDAARGASGDKAAAVTVDVSGELPSIEIDPQLVRQAVVNLVTNAMQVSQRRRPIVVQVHAPSADLVRVDVTDDGPGVPPELRERIFTPFFTTRASGSGLGLAVVQQVAEAHGGRVSVRPAEHYGSVFSLELCPR